MTITTLGQLAPVVMIFGIVLTLVLGEFLSGFYLQAASVMAGVMLAWATVAIGSKAVAWIRREVIGDE